MSRRGVTLVELLVVLAIMGIAGGLTSVAVRALGGTEEPVPIRAAEARERATRGGVAVSIEIDGESVTFFPDGSSARRGNRGQWLVDPWTGEVTRAGT